MPYRERDALEQSCLEARQELAAMQVSLQQVSTAAHTRPGLKAAGMPPVQLPELGYKLVMPDNTQARFSCDATYVCEPVEDLNPDPKPCSRRLRRRNAVQTLGWLAPALLFV
jgi:hypothetical protein